jgi:hypothetical protein
MLLDFFGLAHPGIARGKEKILIHDRPKVDKHGHQNEQHHRDSEHFPMRAEGDQFIANSALHRISKLSLNFIAAPRRAPCKIAK